MYTSQKTIATPNAATYATQLGTHFGHKIAVEQSDTTVVFHFPFGTGHAHVAPEHLTLTACAETHEQMVRLARVLATHLERFAFRENLSLVWPEDPQSSMSETP